MKCKLSVRRTGSSDPFRKKICRSRFFPCGHSQRQDNELVFLNGRQDLPPGHAHYRSTHLSQHDFNIAARPPCDFGEEQSQYLLTSTWLEKNWNIFVQKTKQSNTAVFIVTLSERPATQHRLTLHTQVFQNNHNPIAVHTSPTSHTTLEDHILLTLNLVFCIPKEFHHSQLPVQPLFLTPTKHQELWNALLCKYLGCLYYTFILQSNQ